MIGGGSQMREEFRTRIIAEANGVAELYRFGKKIDQPATREQKEFIEGIVATDYDGRTVIELLQNGHDAHPAERNDGRLEFLLRDDEGQWGVLYVANGGYPVRHDDFTAMCRVAMSNKRPDEGIGNKGVGFKSVLQLADSPEIYSAAEADSACFEGFCFRFASPADFDDLAARVAPGEPGLADELRENVASLKVPVPLDDCPEAVTDFAARGFATVIRLVLRSAEARDQARKQLTELTSLEVPFHLFLERVEQIAVIRVEADQKIRRTVRDRRSVPMFSRSDLDVEMVHLQNSQRYLVLRQRVPEALVKDAIGRSRSDGRVSAGWDKWQGDAHVSVAFPLDTDLVQGRLFTFLPMGEATPAPIAGFVNAPFFARLDRRSLDTAIPLNDLLLGQAAQLCARATQLAVHGELDLPPHLVVDLVTWRKPFLSRLVAAFDALGQPITDVPFIPALGDRRPRTTLSSGWLWETTVVAFAPAAAAEAGVDDIIDPALNPQRRRRLKQLGDDLGLGLTPGDEELAGWAEMCATALGRESIDPERWADFYDGLAAEMTSGASLAGKRIVLDEHGAVISAGMGKDGGPMVFFAPQVSDDAQPSTVSPPSAVAERIAFTHPAIAWRPADPRRKHPRGQEWLKQHDLVQEYRTDAVLNLVGSAMRAADRTDDPLLRSCLLFAFAVWRNTVRDVAAEVIARAGLLVPAAAGWRAANGALFGAGWPGPSSAVDDLLVRLVKRVSSLPGFDNLATCIILEPRTLVDDDDPSLLRTFLEQAGVRHGLMPWWLPAKSFRLLGSRVGSPATAPHLPVDVPVDHQKAWREVAARWPRQPPARPTVVYEPATSVAVLPGQFAHRDLDLASRGLYAELILHGLDRWADSTLEFQYRRPSDARAVAWPTFLAAFLATADWLPQTTPGRRTEVVFAPPAEAWWLAAAETPDYLRAQPPALRSLATPKVLDRLKKIGVRCWDDPATSADRLIELTDLVGSRRLGGRAQPGLAVRKAYELAWRDLVNTGAGVPVRDQLQVVAARAGRLAIVPVADGAETVYVADEAGVPQERLLQQAQVLTLAVRNPQLAKQVHRLLDAAGAVCLRSTADAKVSITIDGQPAALAPGSPLVATVGSWLITLVLGVMEFRSRTIADMTSAQLRLAAQRLEGARLTVAGGLSTSIDGYQVDDPRDVRSFLLELDETTCLVVTGARDEPKLTMLQAASHGLAELVGMPTEADNLRLAFIDLQRRCGDVVAPAAGDIAAVLGVTDADVATLTAAHASGRVDVTLLIPLLACLDVDLAEELQDARDQFDGQDALRSWLAARLSSPGVTADALLELADHRDLLESIRTLGIDFATANRGLRALAHPPLHNTAGQARQFAAYLQHHRRALQDRVRDAFLAAYRAGEPLDAYLRLRQLPGLQPDEGWLDLYWDLPEQLVADQVETWLHDTVPVPDREVELASVDDIREANRRSLSRILTNAMPLVDAWLHRNTAGEGRRPADTTTVADTMTQAGALDFERLTSRVVVRWLHANHQWPVGMPLTTNRADLGLTEQDVADARGRLDQAKDSQRRAPTYVRVDGHTFSTDGDLLALADAVRGGLTPALLATPADPLTLNESGVTLAAGGRGTSVGFYGSTQRSAPSPDVLKAIGLAGEVAVGEWLRHQFGVAPEESWVSGYRNLILGDGQGNDSLGYDFRIISDERTRLFEVKATVDDYPEFTLGETEVRRAQNLQPDENYMIIFVTHVLDSTRRGFTPLPNPLAPGGLRHYRVAGRSIRLQFDLSQT
jgi:hypothetical protein